VALRQLAVRKHNVQISRLLAIIHGALSAWVSHESDEVVLLTVFALVLLDAGFAERSHGSTAVAAFLAGVAMSGPIAEKSRNILSPLRDLFAAIFLSGCRLRPPAFFRSPARHWVWD
jgi:monovalent cation:H+ antiporter-2, CPA2 family